MVTLYRIVDAKTKQKEEVEQVFLDVDEVSACSSETNQCAADFECARFESVRTFQQCDRRIVSLV